MSKPNLSNFCKRIKSNLGKHSPEILVGIGIAGMITTTVMAVKATPKAMTLIEQKKKEEELTTLPPVDVVKTTWKCYIPSAIVGCLSVCCLIGSNSVNTRRNAALATAYTLSESYLKDYKEKATEIIGEKREQAIKDAVAKEQINRNPIVNQEVFITEKGNTLCYDVISGRYFKSDIEKLKKTENELNKQMLDDSYISLNDFYYEIGLNNTTIGDELGWNISDGLINLNFSSQLTEDDTPCLVIDYHAAPRYDFSSCW